MSSEPHGVVVDRLELPRDDAKAAPLLDTLAGRYRSIPGVLDVQCWRAVSGVTHVSILDPAFRPAGAAGGTEYMVLCDLESPAVAEAIAAAQIDQAQAPDWAHARRWGGEQLFPGRMAAPDAARGLMTIYMLRPPAEVEEEFNAWYNTEHIPTLSALPGALGGRRFHNPEAPKPYLAMYHLQDPSLCASDLWRETARTPWTAHVSGLRRAAGRVEHDRVVYARV